MPTPTKTIDEVKIDEIMEELAEHLRSLPEDERKQRIKAAASYSFEPLPPQPRISTPRSGPGRPLVPRRAPR
jgi:hypothetical protein